MAEAITLYTNPQSRGRIARWMLEEVGAPYEAVVLDFGPQMRAAAYRAVNPMAKVPAIRHGARVVTEAAAICAYLAEAFPAAGLMGEDRASYYRWLFFAAGPLEQAVTAKAFGFQVPEGREGAVGFGSFERVMDTLEEALAGGGYVAGPAFSAADLYLGAQIGWGMMFGTIPARPTFAAYWARLKDRPARLRADAIDTALIPKKE